MCDQKAQNETGELAANEVNKLALLQRVLARFATPLLEMSPRGSFELLGTLTLLHSKGEYFGVTATHVVNDTAAGKPTFILDANARPFEVKLDFLAGVSKDELNSNIDKIDIAVSKISQSAARRMAGFWKFWPDDACHERRCFDESIGYSIMGFPGSKNKYRYSIHPVPYIATKMEASPDSYQRYGADPRNSISFDFNSKDMFLFDPRNPEKRVFPALNGMSGGPVWRVADFSKGHSFLDEPRMVGIIIEQSKDRKFLMASKIQIALRAIEILQRNTRPNQVGIPDARNESAWTRLNA